MRLQSYIPRLLLFLLLASGLVHAAEPELLEPEKAFRFEARLKDARSIEVTYRIAPGYYLYRDKFKFSLAPQDAKAGSPQLPPGKKKHDEFFGELETYRGDLSIVLPFELPGPSVPAITLTAVSQGCADVGVCYVPQEQKALLRLASAGGPATDASLSELFGLKRTPAGADDIRIAGIFGGGFWLTVASFFGFGLLLAFTPCVLPMMPIVSSVIVGGGRRVTKIHGLLLAAAYVLGMALTYAVAGIAAGLSGTMLATALQTPWVLGAFAAICVILALAMFGV